MPGKRTGSPAELHVRRWKSPDLQRFYTFPVDGPLRREYDGKNKFWEAAMKKKTTFGLLGLAAAGAGAADRKSVV